MTFIFDSWAEPTCGIQMKGPAKFKTHPAEQCAGRACVIHNPSDHHMKDWPTNYRADRNLTERLCAHGIGHPDPDDISYKVSIGLKSEGVHGCCGCCLK